MTSFGKNCPECGCYISHRLDDCPACGYLSKKRWSEGASASTAYIQTYGDYASAAAQTHENYASAATFSLNSYNAMLERRINALNNDASKSASIQRKEYQKELDACISFKYSTLTEMLTRIGEYGEIVYTTDTNECYIWNDTWVKAATTLRRNAQ